MRVLPISLIRTAVAGAILALTLAAATGAGAAEPVFTVAKYPVEASGANAVAAKRQAIDQGRRAAFRSLLKRLVPASAYGQIEHLKKLDPESYIGGIRVRSEKNTATRYIATLDFTFEAREVRAMLDQHGVTYVDRPAPETALLLFYKAPDTGVTGAMTRARGERSWRSVWAGLDLANSLAPLKLMPQTGDPSAEVAKALLAAEPEAVARLADRYRTAHVIIAEAQPLPGGKELQVMLAGQDAVGRFSVATRYRIDDEDFVYTLELAAVIAQGVLEGRWKVRSTDGGQPSGDGAPVTGGALASLQILAEFNNLGQWQRQQQVLARTPGVRNLQIGSLSGRSASISLSYPGGGNALQAALGSQGITLENINGFWILR